MFEGFLKGRQEGGPLDTDKPQHRGQTEKRWSKPHRGESHTGDCEGREPHATAICLEPRRGKRSKLMRSREAAYTE